MYGGCFVALMAVSVRGCLYSLLIHDVRGQITFNINECTQKDSQMYLVTLKRMTPFSSQFFFLKYAK